MFTHYRTQGFILQKTDRGETDRLFTFYTKDFGKLDLLARAERKIKSKLRGGLELFYLSEVEFIQGKAQKTLTDAILLNSFQGLRKDLKKLSVAKRISNVLLRVVKGQEPDEKMWQLLEEAFEKLENWKGDKVNILYHYFLWNLLSILGYQMDLFSCVFCQKKVNPQDLSFSAKHGGLVCGDCKGKTSALKPIEANTVKIARFFLERELRTLERLKVEEEDLKQLSVVSKYYLSSVLSQIE